MRVFQFLGLRFSGPKLAPDHLGLACEALAAAVENGDGVLVRELRDRYLRPWSRFAKAQLAEDSGALGGLSDSFASDLDALGA
jgi:TorA maturation chaperone TorD